MEEEYAIIGCILIDSDALDKVTGRLKEKHFTNKMLGRIYAVCEELHKKNVKIDAVLICNRIPGALNELKVCAVSAVVSVQISMYADIVIERYRKREYVSIVDHAYELGPQGMISKINAIDSELSSEGNTLKEIYDDIKDEMFNPNYEPKYTYLGFTNIDNLIGGLEDGDICVIGARPAVGKSAFANQIAINLARYKKKVLYFSLEMTKKQIYERMLSYVSGVQYGRIRHSKTFEDISEKKRFESGIKRLDAMNIKIISKGGLQVKDVASIAVKNKGTDVIIIDYLQLMKATTNYKGNRASEVGEISKNLKQLALDIQTPIILLTQLNRNKIETQEPNMSDIRESGDIEQDASVIILLWNTSEDDKTLKGCKIDKCRNGQTGKQMLEFAGPMMTFKESNKQFPSTGRVEGKKEEVKEEVNPFE